MTQQQPGNQNQGEDQMQQAMELRFQKALQQAGPDEQDQSNAVNQTVRDTIQSMRAAALQQGIFLSDIPMLGWPDPDDVIEDLLYDMSAQSRQEQPPNAPKAHQVAQYAAQLAPDLESITNTVISQWSTPSSLEEALGEAQMQVALEVAELLPPEQLRALQQAFLTQRPPQG